MKQAASYFRRLEDDRVECRLCPRFCIIKPGSVGFCRSRVNEAGTLVTLNYGEVAAANIDPIEKKPLYHFIPGTLVYSVGNNGCNLACHFCQNWELSQSTLSTRFIEPDSLLQAVVANGLQSIAFTYAEPSIWFEYILVCAQLCKRSNIRVVLVTNGMINPEPLEELLPFIDAFNIDIKSMNDDFYVKYCHGKLDPALQTARSAARSSHVEITNLVIPELNDREHEFHKLGEFIATELGQHVPLHLSRYHPAYKINLPPTPMRTLEQAQMITRKYLDYVYIGNIVDKNSNSTCCPKCRELLIEREGYRINIHLNPGSSDCPKCGHPTGIVLA